MKKDDKYWSELTEEEQKEFDWNLWQSVEQGVGGPESAIKYMALDPKDLSTTVKTLEIVRDTLASDAVQHELRNEWPVIQAQYIYNLLKMKERSEHLRH